MSVKIDIVIPSMGRADRVVTKNAIRNSIICVPEAEYDDYKKYNPECQIEAHPDSIIGLTLKRQWIIENHKSVFMIDDDIIQYIGNCAKLAGCYLFGISKEANPLAYDEMHPIHLSGVLNGDIGILEGSKLYFHELAKTVEDYWISAYNAWLYRYCWIDMRFSESSQAFTQNTGGCANIRTVEQEKTDTLFLRKMFGEAIHLKEATKLASLKHEYQRTLKIPW